MTLPGEERIYASTRLVVDIMDAAGGASEEAVLGCLRYLRQERGLRPGTKRGPRHFSWFKTVVADYFAQKRDQEFVAGNAGGHPPTLSSEEFDLMTGALE